MHKPRHDLSFVPGILATRKLRIMFSACMLGDHVVWDERDMTYGLLKRMAEHPKVEAMKFCPEHFSFGTPRAFSSIHGGNGFDVLDGRAGTQVLTVEGIDWTEGAAAGGRAMAAEATREGHRADLAILLDMSPACGPVVVYQGFPNDKVYQKGPGVAAAALLRAGIPCLAQRDAASLQVLLKHLDPSHEIDTNLFDHVDNPWYREYFGTGG